MNVWTLPKSKAARERLKRNILYTAIKVRSMPMVRCALSSRWCPVDLNAVDRDKGTLLHLSNRAGCMNITSLLVAHGADPDIHDTSGRNTFANSDENRRCILNDFADLAFLSMESEEDMDPTNREYASDFLSLFRELSTANRPILFLTVHRLARLVHTFHLEPRPSSVPFYIYQFLKLKLDRAKERRALLDKGVSVFRKTFEQLPRLPEPVIDQIFEFLDNTALKIFVRPNSLVTFESVESEPDFRKHFPGCECSNKNLRFPKVQRRRRRTRRVKRTDRR